MALEPVLKKQKCTNEVLQECLLLLPAFGTTLVIVWFLVAYQFAVFEEEKLIEAYGNEYLVYKSKVKWRLIPFLI